MCLLELRRRQRASALIFNRNLCCSWWLLSKPPIYFSFLLDYFSDFFFFLHQNVWNILRKGFAAGWRLTSCCVAVCETCLAFRPLCSVTSRQRQRLDCLLGHMCHTPRCFCHHWPFWSQIRDRPPLSGPAGGALYQSLFACSCAGWWCWCPYP